jgi:hypothetical protein
VASTEPLDAELFAELTDRQRAALPIVLAAPTLKGGLDAAEVARSTWHRWLADPRFRAAWQRLQREVFTEALADLKAGSRFAVTGLLGLMGSKNEQVRLQACREVLALGLKGAEVGELTDRLEKLEAALGPLLEAADL